uniref:Uncharacterized protein n=1 Tax=Heterorhabditis bacteriophora TaxID=37862 RepID=A0A1I7WPW8_HETBA
MSDQRYSTPIRATIPLLWIGNQMAIVRWRSYAICNLSNERQIV